MNLSKKHILVLVCVFIGFFILLTTGLLWKNANTMHIHTAEEQKKINSENNSEAVEFIYTEQEQRDIFKWKNTNKTMDDLVKDAFNGDRAALYNLGEYYFLGLDFPIDVKRANYFFAKSASLGFAPALNNISQMYINDKSNVFLGLVYENLTIAYGHTEFTQTYHKFRNKIIKDFSPNGQRILNEIERIAARKQSKILKNQRHLQDKENKEESRSIVLDKDITYEDYQYDNDYWMDVYNGNNETFDLADIKEKDKTYFEKLYYLYQEAIESDEKDLEDIGFKIQEIIKSIPKHEYSDSEIKLLSRQAYSQAKKVYKYVKKVENNAKEAEKDLKTLKECRKALEEYE